MPMWQSMYMRAALDDAGEYPRKSLVPVSPDLIAYGTKPAERPDDLITDEAWAKYVGDRVESDQTNYLYVRGRNLSARAVSGARVRLHCVPASLVLWPAWRDSEGVQRGWKYSTLKTAGGQDTQDAEARSQKPFVTQDAFELDAAAGAGYSLVGWIETDALPNPVPEPTDIAEVGRYFRDHPDAAALHVPATAAGPGEAGDWTADADYYQGAEARRMLFIVEARHGRAGDELRIGSRDGGGPQPEPPLAGSVVISEDRPAELIFRTSVPEHWATRITLEYKPQEGESALPEQLEITCTAYAVVQDGEPAAAHASDAASLGLPESALPRGEQAVPVGALRYRPEGPPSP